MSERSHLAVRDMFMEYHTKSYRNSEEQYSTKMTKTGLREILNDVVDNDMFDFIWRLFDPDDRGHVDGDEFVVAMALLTTRLETIEDQVDAAFCMFDVSKTGTLSQAEFEQMVRAT